MAISNIITHGLGLSAPPSMILTHGLSIGSATTLGGSPLITVGLGYGSDSARYIITRGLGIAQLPTPESDFLAAFLAKVNAETTLSDLDGRVYVTQAPPNVALPYLVVYPASATDVVYTDVTRIYAQVIRARFYHDDMESADAIGQAFQRAAKDWPKLTFTDGFSIPLREVSRVPAMRMTNLGPGAKPRYYFEVTVRARIHETL